MTKYNHISVFPFTNCGIIGENAYKSIHNKKDVKEKYRIIIIFSLLVITMMLYPVTAQEVPPSSLSYRVTRSNEAVNTWYNADYSEKENYIVPINSTVDVTLENETVSSIIIGNMTRDVTDDEVEENLALGYWQLKGMFGLIANTSWAEVEQDFAKIEFNDSVMAGGDQDVLGFAREVLIFTFEDNYQTTNLVYDKLTGYLIEGSSTVFGFDLKILLVSIDGNPDYYTIAAFLPFPTLALLTVFILPLARKFIIKR